LGAPSLALQRGSGGNCSDLFWNLLTHVKIISFGLFGPRPLSIGRFGKRRVLRSISGGHLCLCVQLS
jgi:hypothetical protein